MYIRLYTSYRRLHNSRRASRENGMAGACLRLYDIVIPNSNVRPPLSRASVPPCLPSSAPPLIRASPLVFRPSWHRVVLGSSWLRVVLRPYGPESSSDPHGSESSSGLMAQSRPPILMAQSRLPASWPRVGTHSILMLTLALVPAVRDYPDRKSS